jgi:hypothetical protein
MEQRRQLGREKETLMQSKEENDAEKEKAGDTERGRGGCRADEGMVREEGWCREDKKGAE